MADKRYSLATLMISREHGENVQSLLALLEQDRDAMLLTGKRLFGAPKAPMFGLDLLAYGAIKRNLSTTTAITQMVSSWNMASARALLRVHIDTALRISAAWLVEQPHDFALKVIGGHRIDKLKDQAGAKLTDAHLVEIRAAEYPWLPKVYESLSGYIHFSGSHVFDSVASLGDEDMSISFEVAATDYKFPESSWNEILECTREATGMLTKYLDGYIFTKRLSPEQLAELRAAANPSIHRPRAKSRAGR
ncbi:MAG: hypothetical protein IPO38_00390 [Rhodocyclaceae bacterium]|nr:hypothetical protein [Rhodocyclaceae bacterium]MBP6108680.1 hypothetical protein [Rhodocyclaceae bacterium]